MEQKLFSLSKEDLMEMRLALVVLSTTEDKEHTSVLPRIGDACYIFEGEENVAFLGFGFVGADGQGVYLKPDGSIELITGQRLFQTPEFFAQTVKKVEEGRGDSFADLLSQEILDADGIPIKVGDTVLGQKPELGHTVKDVFLIAEIAELGDFTELRMFNSLDARHDRMEDWIGRAKWCMEMKPTIVGLITKSISEI